MSLKRRGSGPCCAKISLDSDQKDKRCPEPEVGECPVQVWRESLAGYRRGLFLGTTALFNRRRPVALLKIRKDDGKHELFLSVLIELDNNIFFIAGEHTAESELGVFNLCALSEGGLDGHGEGNPFGATAPYNSL